MLLDVPVRALGPVNHLPLKIAMEAVAPAAWLEDAMRQKAFKQHVHTQSLVLLFSAEWPVNNVEKRSGWDLLSEPAMALIDSIVAQHYPAGGKIIRAMLAKLLPGGVIAVHKDGHPSFAHSHRVHVPLVTNPKVEFVVRGEGHTLAEGVAYEISNLDFHSVRNTSADERVHFIFDYVV